ncbi:hypothetical protein AG1IA_03946 [Rhizoctonia solani AG-1 IA]|uniref:Uncharacterized protein n=1 Tax=Thanatephorus cucumeris (strain AG1-IA) TaxID=983506 RepID=L8WZ21_THACA|nr:hypothetical protein AG1IA_03946 [Rhizoctonia solani AG-1 IA]
MEKCSSRDRFHQKQFRYSLQKKEHKVFDHGVILDKNSLKAVAHESWDIGFVYGIGMMDNGIDCSDHNIVYCSHADRLQGKHVCSPIPWRGGE